MSERPSETGQFEGEFAEAYARLRRIAQKLMTGERVGHTLSATEVVHEAMGKLLSAGWRPSPEDDERVVQFITHASRAMIEVLIDYSRRHSAMKRGGGKLKVQLDDLDDVELTLDQSSFDWAALDRAMAKLRGIDPRRHSVVTLRFFGGLNNQQIAAQLGVDERTVGRDWSAARLWLRDALKEEADQ